MFKAKVSTNGIKIRFNAQNRIMFQPHIHGYTTNKTLLLQCFTRHGNSPHFIQDRRGSLNQNFSE